ncbi:M23 family metallopeptidase [Candidatus Woesearchaeota archaeon]|nr:M23 family metallopeptidase [Candidatus Woesearchaeota archaeon]
MALTKNIYSLPFRRKDLIKAVADPRGHFLHLRHAIDFILPEGSHVKAARAGVVEQVKTDSNKGGADTKYASMKYLNFITIRHNYGEFSQYCHLKHQGGFVRVGEKVREGQAIALSGNTGFSAFPHLHFHVAKANNTKMGWETLKVRFREKVEVDRSRRKLSGELKKMAHHLNRIKQEWSR